MQFIYEILTLQISSYLYLNIYVYIILTSNLVLQA